MVEDEATRNAPAPKCPRPGTNPAGAFFRKKGGFDHVRAKHQQAHQATDPDGHVRGDRLRRHAGHPAPAPRIGLLSYDLKDVVIAIAGFQLGAIPAMLITLVVSLTDTVPLSVPAIVTVYVLGLNVTLTATFDAGIVKLFS